MRNQPWSQIAVAPRPWREREEDGGVSDPSDTQTDRLDPRLPIQSNFRVLARTNVILRAAQAGSASLG